MFSQDQQNSLLQQTKELLKNSQLKAIEKAEAENILPQLRQVLNFHDWLYYVLSEPQIEDIDYDYLFDALKISEERFPELISPDSPTQRVARGLSEDFPTVSHLVPMLSLQKAYNNEDLRDWETSIKKLIQQEEVEYAIEPKYDGASLSLIYENDFLVRGATRGNGTTGDDITNNVKTIPTVPLSAPFSKYGIHRIEVRGEVVISKQKFEQMNKEKEAAGEKLYSNSRNTASGALRQKDSSKVMDKKLEAFVYQVGVAMNEAGNDLAKQVVSHSKGVQMLYDLGFKTPYKDEKEDNHICQSMDEVIAFCDRLRETRDDYDYEIDGIVIKINSLELQELCGATSHHPRWAIALKFDARQAVTTLENVEFQVGRTGAITPVAKLATVNLAGANISNASLHNEEFIKEKDLHIGDQVIVERAGDVIPYIVQVIPEKRDGSQVPVTFPENCPSCQEKVEKTEGEAVWRCVNTDCPAQVEERLIHYVSKGAMDIRGLGRDIIKRFFKDGFIQRIPDIYHLDYAKIQELEGWGERSVAKLKESIEASKDQPLSKLIIGLGIREVGRGTARNLLEAIQSLEELQNWTVEQLIELPDIGPKVAANIVEFFQNEKSQQLLADLKAAGVNMKKRAVDQPKLDSNLLAGKTFLFTGTLQQFTRNDAKKMVESNGGKILSAVSKKLNYLVVGEKAGSKLKKAEKIETVSILTEEEFLAMVNPAT